MKLKIAKQLIHVKEVTSISANAFANNANLEKITIPSSVVKIAAGAFSGCSKNLVIRASANSAAYVNSDGYINSTDATLILQYFAGIITSF